MKLIFFLLCFIGNTLASDTNTIVLTVDNMLSINDVFDSDSVANIIYDAKKLDSRVESTDPIYLVINSPGGSIEDGLELINNLASLRRPVKTITIKAFSMGFQTVQGLSERLILKKGTLMSHKARGGFRGEFPGQLDSRYEFYKRRVQKLDETAVSRTKGKHTLKSYQNLIENEFWCSAEDCLKEGFADKIISAQCDKSLRGGYLKPIYQSLVKGHTIEVIGAFDKCALNTNGIEYVVLIDGQPLFNLNSSKFLREMGIIDQITNDNSNPVLGLFNSLRQSITQTISAEDLFEIKKTYQEVISNHVSKLNSVIKGY